LTSPHRHLNHLRLSAAIAALQPLRETPAGLSALDLQLQHSSQQTCQGGVRSVKLLLKAVAFGTLAQRLARQELDSQWLFQGFLSAARNGRGLVFTIEDMQPL